MSERLLDLCFSFMSTDKSSMHQGTDLLLGFYVVLTINVSADLIMYFVK